MDKAEFDQFADEYEAQHRANIVVTGEGPEFFASYKIASLAEVAAGLPIVPNHILDFGSGIGNSIPFFREHFPGAALTCADVSSRSLALSRRRFSGSEHYTLINNRTIPHESNTFDVTFSACVFHHLRPDEHVHWLAELLRVTKEGGLFAIFEHNPANPLTVRAVNTCPFDENASLIRARALLRALEEAGWRQLALRYHLFFARVLAWLRATERYLGWLPLGAQYSVTARKV